MDPISAVSGAINTIVSRIWPDKTQVERDKLTAAMQEEQGALAVCLAQIQASVNLPWYHFRNLAGLVCVAGLAVDFVIRPLMQPLGYNVPSLDLSQLLPMLLGMLGLGSMHAYERTR